MKVLIGKAMVFVNEAPQILWCRIFPIELAIWGYTIFFKRHNNWVQKPLKKPLIFSICRVEGMHIHVSQLWIDVRPSYCIEVVTI